ncbi:Coenzyme F420 hydrogenase/dehydrogenase, beta subunit C-terminal domain [Bacteroides caecimuris]|uniref:Coenzyme F420 hydrogenase/dehydrogenase, beta subunit C-terminal domain n=1 Tax=Bacteroides caecimuris TaxID=1796613 RepID=UPI00260F9C9F|nr:Coenzyme F420 hydrogenase/dehydrogenase, beta subunit C-terminal domain [Bacteroides caecimuris]
MRTKVFYNLPETACYGCQACAQICPVSAIEMKSDKEGFLFPKIDTEKCIECNLCEKSCPTQEKVSNPLFHPTPENVDAAWEKDFQARLESTSGGAFYVMAKRWIENGGVVYGAEFDENLCVRHQRADSIDALKRQRGSKYVQSNLDGIMKQVKADLVNGVKVLFSGTPCQVAGLRSFLKKDYPNLICIDLVCHGVPSPMIFTEHLRYIETTRGKQITDYKFRGKERSGWRAYIKYIFKDCKEEKNFLGEDFYAYCFYNSRFNRRSCFTCGFSQSQRVGDITLSDFWNAEKVCKSLRIPRKYGFNMVMCNTPKGEALYQSAIDKLEHLSLPVKVAIEGDVRLRHTEDAPVDRESIFDEYYSHGYNWLVENRGPHYSIASRYTPTWLKNLVYEIKARI